ncbi:MAG: hypothetical protein LBC95_02440 [Candidatus Nomurabacteria bacterium]|jgi:hypothetical protein|nr:hypothetical protein [Candidatus Nomurabacteria bacterium]
MLKFLKHRGKKTKKAEKPLKKFPVFARPFVRFGRMIKRWFSRQIKRHRDFMKRRPHRSLFLTRRRDSNRSLKLPGYFAFSHQVWQWIWRNKKIFTFFILLYSLLSLILVGTLNQGNYVALRDQLNNTGEDLGISKWVSLFTNAVSSGTGEEVTIASQIVAGLLILMGWLVVVWILRRRMAGDKIRLRDALYSAGSPIMATFMLLIIIVAQLLPLALALLAYASLSGVGVINLDISIENMAAWCALAAVAALTLYWLTTSFIALVIVTNPGVYPFQAISLAGDMVVGRRLKIMLRLLFMLLPMLVMWLVVLLPVILLDDAIRIDWLPLVPLASLILTTLTLVWAASYIYVLYRRIMDDKDPPAKRVA